MKSTLNMAKTSKKASVGRPLGLPKKPINLYILEGTVKKLKRIARQKGATMSSVVECAVDMYDYNSEINA